MARGSDNIVPQLIIVEGSAPSVTATGTYPGIPSGDQALFIDSADHTVKLVNHSGTVTPVGSSAIVTIATVTVTGSVAATIGFTSIPGTYKHLRLIGQLQGDTAATFTAVDVIFNSDTAANYDVAYASLGASAAAALAFGQTSINHNNMAAASAPANTATDWEISIPNYAGTTFHKSVAIKSGLKYGTASPNFEQEPTSAVWKSTTAITAITLTPAAGNFSIGSTMSLYGWS